MTKAEILEVATRWNSTHDSADFEILYKAFHPLIIRTINRYHPELQYRELAPCAFASLLKAIKTHKNKKYKTSLYSWIAITVGEEVHKMALSLLYPGVSESSLP